MDLTWKTHALRTEQPFGIARWTFSDYPRTVVSAVSDGRVGQGECAPNAYYAESPESVLEVLPRLAQCVEDPWDWDGLAARMLATTGGAAPSARCGVEAAVLEWCAVTVGQPVWRLLGLGPIAIPPTSVTVGLGTAEEMALRAQNLAEAGHRLLKVKLGRPDDEDLIAAVRRGAPEAALRVDANAGWTRQAAHRMVHVLADQGVELIEQPLDADDLDGLRALTARSPVPIVADESLHHPTDVLRLQGAVHGVNVKLAKLGGPLQALATIRLARAAGLQVMLGCMVETSLGIAAAVHLAGLVDWVDLDGAMLLAADPYAGLQWDGATVTRPAAPGWGVSPM